MHKLQLEPTVILSVYLFAIKLVLDSLEDGLLLSRRLSPSLTSGGLTVDKRGGSSICSDLNLEVTSGTGVHGRKALDLIAKSVLKRVYEGIVKALISSPTAVLHEHINLRHFIIFINYVSVALIIVSLCFLKRDLYL
jgi:hypothetical protein